MKKSLFAIAFLMLGTSAANAACSSQKLSQLQASQRVAIIESEKIAKLAVETEKQQDELATKENRDRTEAEIAEVSRLRTLAASYSMIVVNTQQEITSCYVPGF